MVEAGNVTGGERGFDSQAITYVTLKGYAGNGFARPGIKVVSLDVGAVPRNRGRRAACGGRIETGHGA